MLQFRYEAREMGGAPATGVLEAEDRQSALRALGERGLFPFVLEASLAPAPLPALPAASAPVSAAVHSAAVHPGSGGRIRRKDITAFTRELATLIGATISIPAALEGLGAEEENPALRALLLDLLAKVRTGSSLSHAMESHPKLFPVFTTSMIRVGEESGALDKVLADLAEILEHQDETRSEALSAVAYPCFVLAMGIATGFVLLAFVLPRLFEMLKGMADALPLPTRMLLALSGFFQAEWPWILCGAAAATVGLRAYFRSAAGAVQLDALKLRVPVLGGIFRASALARFARMLGILLRSGVSLLPALEIVRHTVGNRVFGKLLEKVAEEARGGDSLAVPLRKTGMFPATLVQMLAVGEDTGRLDEMLLRVALIEERNMRGRSRTVISLLAPALILVVGAFVGFIVIALLLPIFRMSQSIQ